MWNYREKLKSKNPTSSVKTHLQKQLIIKSDKNKEYFSHKATFHIASNAPKAIKFKLFAQIFHAIMLSFVETTLVSPVKTIIILTDK